MDFVNQGQAFADQAELILGVHQNQPRFPGHRLPAPEDGQGRLFNPLPERGRHHLFLDYLLAREALVVLPPLRLGRGRNHRFRQRVILLQAVRQRDPIGSPLPPRVQGPERGIGHARDVAAHDHLYR